MNLLEKEFVPYEQALALKKLGFDEPCFALMFTENKQLIQQIFDDTRPYNKDMFILAPTFSQAFRWFREKYGLRIRNYGSINYSKELSEYFEVFKYGYGTSDKSLSIVVGALTYEEAELACLRKLIEIVKQNQ